MQITSGGEELNKYNAPSSDLVLPTTSNKPVRAVVYASMFSMFGIFIFSMIISIVFAAMNHIDATNEDVLRKAISSSPGFMVVDLVGSFAFLLIAGRIVAKYVPTKRMIFSIVVTIIVTMVFGGSLFSDAAAMSTFPVWYISLIAISMVLGVPLGAKLTATA